MKSIPSDKKFKSRKEWESYAWAMIVRGISEVDSFSGVNNLLGILLTEHEKIQMINRASAISLLKQGMSYRDIGKVLWLSPGTISAIRKSIREQEGYTSRYFRSKKSNQSIKSLAKKELGKLQFNLRLESLFRLPPPPLRHPRLMRSFDFKDRS